MGSIPVAGAMKNSTASAVEFFIVVAFESNPSKRSFEEFAQIKFGFLLTLCANGVQIPVAGATAQSGRVLHSSCFRIEPLKAEKYCSILEAPCSS